MNLTSKELVFSFCGRMRIYVGVKMQGSLRDGGWKKWKAFQKVVFVFAKESFYFILQVNAVRLYR